MSEEARLAAIRDDGIWLRRDVFDRPGPILAFALCDHAVVVRSVETARVQEVHIAVGHAVLELVEDRLLGRGP